MHLCRIRQCLSPSLSFLPPVIRSLPYGRSRITRLARDTLHSVSWISSTEECSCTTNQAIRQWCIWKICQTLCLTEIIYIPFPLISTNSYRIFFHKNSSFLWCEPTKTGWCSIKVAISRASSALCVHRAELVGDCIPKPQPPTPVSWKICLLCSFIFHSSA